MKLTLNRSVCNCWEAACESDFADKYLGKEIKPTACTVEIEDDGSDVLTFEILDRDGQIKIFKVNEENLAEAIDSWTRAYAKQQEKLIQVP